MLPATQSHLCSCIIIFDDDMLCGGGGRNGRKDRVCVRCVWWRYNPRMSKLIVRFNGLHLPRFLGGTVHNNTIRPNTSCGVRSTVILVRIQHKIVTRIVKILSVAVTAAAIHADVMTSLLLIVVTMILLLRYTVYYHHFFSSSGWTNNSWWYVVLCRRRIEASSHSSSSNSNVWNVR